ncbi:MAG TPA: hybrid sensor histidine kinase/response regulator [Cyanobacteria bacterium UBA11369]|nr:hybrid sensor histidine kinase/response regulator [Cyanobacteria bacterium UBA11371]HBE32916.1 hybrid sensor histidine kinase/response regulator [Cyanobacteria bacterium UBA11368]HBE49315.1 hybrid sensor histidine kinase/response regulator [Cyanobacteria bacterium UBA11369]
MTALSLKDILIVDDTPDNLRVLDAILKSQGYKVRKALNGQIALNACQIAAPDIILLDIIMPGIDGYEVCRRLKADTITCEIPVIFISAIDDTMDKVKAFEVGAVDYIAKPFQEAEVLARIEHQLNLRSLQIKLQEQNTLLQQAFFDLKQAQIQMIQNEKMVALGQLVAGIAHEINNPINFIYGNLSPAIQYIHDLLYLIDVYQQDFPKPTPRIEKIINDLDLNFLKEDLLDIMGSMGRGADRIRQIVLSLRNFSRLDQSEIKRVDIHEGIESTLLILQHRLRETDARPTIQVIKEYGQNLPLVNCYPGQLNQVFLHLLNNAIDALQEGSKYERVGGGEDSRPRESANETFSGTSKGMLRPSPLPTIRISTELKDADTVKIRIADNGFGIPESVRASLFDPFVTTKPTGSGMGLGLAISYQIVVQQHKGKLICCSSPRQGAEFAIEIPVHQPQPY